MRGVYLFVIAIIFLLGCTNTQQDSGSSYSSPSYQSPQYEQKAPAPSCPICNDNNPCTQDYCNVNTNYICKYDALNGPQPGCSGNAGSCKIKSCNSGSCQIKSLTGCCGNSICESGESYQNCATDCPAPKENFVIEVVGCKRSFDVTHGLGEVRDMYVTVNNIGNADATNVLVQAWVEGKTNKHPDGKASISNLPVGYQVTKKLTVDTTIGANEHMMVNINHNQINIFESVTDCAEINPNLIKNLNTLVQIAGMAG